MMAFEQNSTSILRKNPSPVKISGPDGDHATTSGSLAQARITSSVLPLIHSMTPTSILRTPPLEPQPPSRGRNNTSVTSNNFLHSSSSSHQIARTVSPSDNLSTTLSPTLSSGGGSVYSSDTGHSVGSSNYLTPPQSQADLKERPYKARRSSSESLSMMRRPRRASSLPHDKKRRKRCRHSRKNKCQHETSSEQTNQYYWSQSSCQVVPHAPNDMKRPCIGHAGRHEPHTTQRGDANTYGQVLSRPCSHPAQPIISRRWSSVEIGSQANLASTVPNNSIWSVPGRQRSTTDTIRLRRISRSNKSAIPIHGAIDYDVIRTIQEKLTLRRVSSSQLQIPASITLRRASGARAESSSSTVMKLSTPMNGEFTGSITAQSDPKSQIDTKTDTAYLITRSEIDSITDLVEANLQRNRHPYNRINTHPPAQILSPILSLKAIIPKTAALTASTVTTTQSDAVPPSTADYLSSAQVALPSRTQPRTDTRSPSLESAHMVIWEAEGSPNGMCSLGDNSELKRSSISSNSTQAYSAPSAGSPKRPQLPPVMMDKEGAFGHEDFAGSNSCWSWPYQQPGSSTNATFSRSLLSAPEIPNTTKVKSTTSRRLEFVSPEVKDVVSFPPLLERRSTSEWCSPLPDINNSPRKSQSTKSLYSEGIDASGVIPTNSHPPKSPRHPPFPVMDPLNSATQRVELNPDFDVHQGRRNSIFKVHPHAPARTGIQHTIGSSIGVSSGQRRRSSNNPGVRRVRTIDHVSKGSRAGTWTRNRPPSICPPPISMSSTETSDDEGGVSPPNVSCIGPPRKQDCDNCVGDPERKPSVDWIG